MANYPYRVLGSCASHDLAPHLDRYVHPIAEAVKHGRWNSMDHMDHESAQEIAEATVAATRQTETIERWRQRNPDGEHRDPDRDHDDCRQIDPLGYWENCRAIFDVGGPETA